MEECALKRQLRWIGYRSDSGRATSGGKNEPPSWPGIDFGLKFDTEQRILKAMGRFFPMIVGVALFGPPRSHR
jgi:hypothetical protein